MTHNHSSVVLSAPRSSGWLLLFLLAGASCTVFNGSSVDDSPPEVGGNGGVSGGGGIAGTEESAGQGGQVDKGKACAQPSDCDDKNPCTIETCEENFCKIVASPSGASCDDGNRCNGISVCDELGECIQGKPIEIDDQNECTKDECDPATGNVNHKNLDHCQPCEQDADCNDGNPCVIGQCSSNKCVFFNQPQGAFCDDGDKCTDSDRCDGAGKCTSSLKSIDDGNPCTLDACDPNTGEVSHQANFGKVCSDGNKCTSDDQCDATGTCVGVPVPIDDGDVCTEDACDPTTGNVTHLGKGGCKNCSSDSDCNDGNPCTKDTCINTFCSFLPGPPEVLCNDGNNCTSGDVCNGEGKCLGVPYNVDDGNPCTKDECEPSTGNTKHTPILGVNCNDGNACTLNDTCNVNGSCEGVPKNIDDGNACTKDSCDPETGNIYYTYLKDCKPCSANSDCDDGNFCTTDSCGKGKCSYTPVPAKTKCDDGNACTASDACDSSGKCIGKPKLCGTPMNDCYQETGTCNPVNGECVYPLMPDGSKCEDGDLCTLNDSCSKGVCTSLAIKSCFALVNSCDASGTCNSSTGNCEYTKKPNGTKCDDNDNCTNLDKCTNGVCMGTPVNPCMIEAEF